MKLPYPNAPVADAIATKFELYRTIVLPHNAPPIQVRECDLAFHGGAEAMFDLLMEESPEEEGPSLVYMQSLKNELVARAARYAGERAKAAEAAAAKD